MIHEFLANAEDVLLLPELKYLEALCYQNLSEMDKALNLFDQLESDPGFGDSLSNVIRNKIIYDKTNIYKKQANGDKKALEYLTSLGDIEPNNYVSVSYTHLKGHKAEQTFMKLLMLNIQIKLPLELKILTDFRFDSQPGHRKQFSIANSFYHLNFLSLKSTVNTKISAIFDSL